MLTRGNATSTREAERVRLEAVLVQRARSFLSSTPRPFVKWAGSKRWLLPYLVPLLPTRFRTYWEPFLGSGALFFLLTPAQAILGDSCGDLIDTFEAVRDNPAAILRYLHPLRPNKTTFYAIRKKRSLGRFQRAAEFIYLNKTCWNGLYRVNSSGLFNVPYGKPKGDGQDDANLRACGKALAKPGVRIETGDFEEVLEDVRRGDLVYLDPPYVTGHSNNGFIDYNEKLFAWGDQRRLAEVASKLARKGARVVVTNADHSGVRDLYPGFAVVPVDRCSTLAGTMTARRSVRELIIHNLNPVDR